MMRRAVPPLNSAGKKQKIAAGLLGAAVLCQPDSAHALPPLPHEGGPPRLAGGALHGGKIGRLAGGGSCGGGPGVTAAGPTVTPAVSTVLDQRVIYPGCLQQQPG